MGYTDTTKLPMCDRFTLGGVRPWPVVAPKLMAGRHRTDAKSASRALWAFHRALEGHRPPRAKETADGGFTVMKDEGNRRPLKTQKHPIYAEVEAQQREAATYVTVEARSERLCESRRPGRWSVARPFPAPAGRAQPGCRAKARRPHRAGLRRARSEAGGDGDAEVWARRGRKGRFFFSFVFLVRLRKGWARMESGRRAGSVSVGGANRRRRWRIERQGNMVDVDAGGSRNWYTQI